MLEKTAVSEERRAMMAGASANDRVGSVSRYAQLLRISFCYSRKASAGEGRAVAARRDVAQSLAKNVSAHGARYVVLATKRREETAAGTQTSNRLRRPARD